PARGNHWDRDRVRERNGGVEIEALEQAVARNVGVDDCRNARILEAARDVERRELGRLRPALDRDLAVARIETDRYAARKRAGGALAQLGAAHRRGADHHAIDPLPAPPLYRCHT